MIANEWLWMIANDCEWLRMIVDDCKMIVNDCEWLLMIVNDYHIIKHFMLFSWVPIYKEQQIRLNDCRNGADY